MTPSQFAFYTPSSATPPVTCAFAFACFDASEVLMQLAIVHSLCSSDCHAHSDDDNEMPALPYMCTRTCVHTLTYVHKHMHIHMHRGYEVS